jgi:hypothetical protein
LLSSDQSSIKININSPQIKNHFFGNSKLVLSVRLVSSLEVFLSVVSSNGPDKYYIYYLGGVIVSINNKFIIDKDILNSEIRVLSITKLIFFLNMKKTSRKFFFFLGNNIRICKEKILLLLLELESNSKSAFDKLLSEIIGLGSCFSFFNFLFLFFLEGL